MTGPVINVIPGHQLETLLKMNFTMIIFLRIPKTFRDYLQITPLIFYKFKQINFYSPEIIRKPWSADNPLNSLNVKSENWRRSLKYLSIVCH